MFDSGYAIVPAALVLSLGSMAVASTPSSALGTQSVTKPQVTCSVKSGAGRLETCIIRVFETRVYRLRYSYYSERYDREKEGTIRIDATVGPARELPGLRSCESVKLGIDNATLATVECSFEMYMGPDFAFKALVVTENGKNGGPKPGLEIF